MTIGSENARKSVRRKWIFRLILAAGAAALYFLATDYFKEEPAPRMTYTVHKGNIEKTVMATGTLRPARLVAVGAQASGRILSFNVHTGQKIKKNDLIAQIDPTTQRNELLKAQAEEVRNQADLADKTARLQLARQDLSRQQHMVARNAVARADYDKAVSALKTAEAQVALSNAQIEVSKIAVETAQANLGYTQVRAPIDGTILATVIQEGQTVNAVQSAPTIAIIGQLEEMTVETDISEVDVVNVKPGQDLYFTIPGQNSKRYNAKLQILEPAPQSIVNDKSFGGSNNAGSGASTASAIYYKGIFNVANPEDILKTYMTAEVNIILGKAENVLLIPVTALIKAQNGRDYYVQIPTADGSVENRLVETGLNNKTMVEIRSGLKEGEIIINDALPEKLTAPSQQSGTE